MDPKLIFPVLMAMLIAWAIYRRVRRTIGRQALAPARMKFRIGLLGVIGVLILLASVRDLSLLGATLGGIACGTALGFIGLRHTKFETTAQGQFYTPHTYIGLLVSALFLGRILYRFLYQYQGMQAAGQANANPFAAYQSNPLTLAIFGVLIGYYIAYYTGVLNKCRSLAIAPAPTGE